MIGERVMNSLAEASNERIEFPVRLYSSRIFNMYLELSGKPLSALIMRYGENIIVVMRERV